MLWCFSGVNRLSKPILYHHVNAEETVVTVAPKGCNCFTTPPLKLEQIRSIIVLGEVASSTKSLLEADGLNSIQFVYCTS